VSTKPKPQRGVQSIEIGVRLLRALAKAPRSMMLKDLAAAAQMPAPQAHRYLVSFARMGFIEQIAESGHYDIGPFALQLGLAALARMEHVALAAPALAALREEVGQTVALAVWANQGPTIVRWLSADTPVAATLRMGSVMPLTRSATGGVFLAFLPRSTTQSLVERELQENVRHGIAPATAAELEGLIQRTRRLGFLRISDFIPGIAGISAPVFDHTGAMVLALIALGYSKPFTAKMDVITAAICQASAQLSARFGYSPSRAQGGSNPNGHIVDATSRT
jgi:DNA-binding IclR family transcriptional regulator